MISNFPHLRARFTRLTQQQIPEPFRLSDQARIWVLRDDELGGFWGSKFRKYASITQYCLSNGLTDIIATGGVNSNNLVAANILCREVGLKVTSFAVRDHYDKNQDLTGNRLLLRLCSEPSSLHVIERDQKSKIPELMELYANEIRSNGRHPLILQEGGGCQAAISGSLSLVDNIFEDQQIWQNPEGPDHIFIDSGTGLTSGSLAAGMLMLGEKSLRTKLHIVQMAGFTEQIIHAFTQWIKPETGIDWMHVKKHTEVHKPSSPKSYGAVSQSLLDFIHKLCQQSGILTDPVYSGKLFLKAFSVIEERSLTGDILLVHTGGLTGLLGFAPLISDRFSLQGHQL